MKIKLLIIAILLACVTCAFSYEDGYMLGGNNCGTFFYNEDLSKSFNKVFDVPVTLASNGEVQSIVTDKVAILVASDRIYSYELGSGQELWKYPKDKGSDERVTSTAISFEGKVYFTTSKTLYCMDEVSGKILWRKEIYQTLSPIFKVSAGVMYIALDDRKVYRLNPNTGEDVADPIVYQAPGAKNNLLVKDNYLVVTTLDNSLITYDLKKSDKKKYSFSIPASAAPFKPIIVGNYIIVTSGEQIALYNLETGKEIGRKKFSSPIAASSITNGSELFVACINANLYKINIDKKLSEIGEPFKTANVVKNFIAVSDNNILIEDALGLITTYDLNNMNIVWQFETGMYTAGGVTTTVPGFGTSDIAVQTQNMNGMGGRGGNQGMGGRGGRGGNQGMGGRGGRGGRGMGAWRSESLDTNGILIAQGPRGGFGGPMGGPGMPGGMGPGMPGMGPGVMGPMGGQGMGRPGMGGRGGMMGGMNDSGKTINYVTVVKQNGVMYDLDMDKFYNDPSREFVPSTIISQPFYANGYLAYVTSDGHFRVRSINSLDNQEPYTFEFTPGSNDTNKTISGIADILVKVCVFDKGSGINFKTAKLSSTDVNGKVYNSKLIFDPVKQIFYGYIKNDKEGSIISPFADGVMKCTFILEDYSGNILTKEFSFTIDSSVAVKEETIPGGSYLDVITGNLIDVDVTEFVKGTDGYSNSGSDSNGSNGTSDNSVANSSNNNSGGVSGVSQGEKVASANDKKKI